MGACQRLTSSRRTTRKLLSPIKHAGLGDVTGPGASWMPCFSRVSFSVPVLASLRMLSGFHNIHSQLSYLGWRTWQTKAVSQGLSGSLCSLLRAIRREGLGRAGGQGTLSLSGQRIFRTSLRYLPLLRRNYMRRKFLFHCTLPLISPCRATASCECE